MKCYIRKDNNESVTEGWDSSYLFTIRRETPRTVYSSIFDDWYHMKVMELDPKYEDLFIVGLSVFAIDKEVSRTNTDDRWTRKLEVSIPVVEHDVWKATESSWSRMLSFLTGDDWIVRFRKTDISISKRKKRPAVKTIINVEGCDSVCLFSGGLDSFCGAIHLLSEGKSPLLVGHNEYPKLRSKQEEFCDFFKKCFPKQNPMFIDFSANSHSPRDKNDGKLDETENTSRSRSLLFLCAALSFASIIGKDIKVYIPENGFIGLNVPLTGSRIGSCSTRTTHPYFLNMFRDILKEIGIKNEIINFFEYKTKREIVDMVKDQDAFKGKYMETISCSHPTIPRFDRNGNTGFPKNCGFCYPCLVRRASLYNLNTDNGYYYEEKGYDFDKMVKEKSDKSSDCKAVLSSASRYISIKSDEDEIMDLILSTGNLSDSDVTEFKRVYKTGMEELIELFGGEEAVKYLCNE